MRACVEKISVPASVDWIKGRAGILLIHYYVSDLPPAVTRAVSEDWIAELKDYPQWAITDACRWWMSKDNPKRRSKPIPGDISERANRACVPIRQGEKQIERFEEYGENPPSFMKAVEAAA